MNLKDYIQGKRKGKKANQLEREAMNNPFLHDALDGFDAVDGDHLSAIEKLEKEISQTINGRKKRFIFRHWQVVSMAASIVLVLGVGGFVFLRTEFEHKYVVAERAAEEKTETLALRTNEEASSPEIFESSPHAAIKFTPPVIMPDMEVSDDMKATDVVAIQEEVAEHVPAPMEIIEYDMAATDEVSLNYNFTQGIEKKSSAEAGKPELQPFGKTEFLAYFEKHRKQDICPDTTLYIKADFYIDENGYPVNIHILTSTCKELEIELIRLLRQSPQWTNENKKKQLVITPDDLSHKK